ncbi:hypothetical protein BD626DRAFT_506194 [Schizophyllum amplum]|uniref:Uncharacterized protein n=1 Tax=Schizophyllum amplum TaxID=97359 RepID=A0A550C5D4_9AGAR|nr:hypothetical protein BD626DRAFT_506194 [Auriculariopsis ampla]
MAIDLLIGGREKSKRPEHHRTACCVLCKPALVRVVRYRLMVCRRPRTQGAGSACIQSWSGSSFGNGRRHGSGRPAAFLAWLPSPVVIISWTVGGHARRVLVCLHPVVFLVGHSYGIVVAGLIVPTLGPSAQQR